MIEELKQIGLTSGEARVYLALVKLKETTVGPLAKNSKVSYSKLYEVLDRLMEKGFASYIIKEKTKYFQPSPPEQINNFLEQRRKELESTQKIANNLIKQLKPEEKQETKKTIIFTGIKGILSAYELMLKQTKSNETIKYFYQDNPEESEQIMGFYVNRPQFHELLKKYNKEKGVSWKGVFEKTGKDPKKKYMKIKRTNKKMPANVDTSENCAIITTWSGKPQAIFIQSREVARNFRNFFDDVWRES